MTIRSVNNYMTVDCIKEDYNPWPQSRKECRWDSKKKKLGYCMGRDVDNMTCPSSRKDILEESNKPRVTWRKEYHRRPIYDQSVAFKKTLAQNCIVCRVTLRSGQRIQIRTSKQNYGVQQCKKYYVFCFDRESLVLIFVSTNLSSSSSLNIYNAAKNTPVPRRIQRTNA